MEENKKKLLSIYTLIIISIILKIYIIKNFNVNYIKISDTLIWIAILVIALLTQRKQYFKAKKDKVKTVTILLILYYIIYYLLGILYGYGKNPYSHKFLGIVSNLFFIFLIILIQEYTRTKLLLSTNKKNTYIIITILFIILRLNYINFLDNFTSQEKIINYILKIMLIEIIDGGLLTYLSIVGGYYLNYAYIIPTTLINLLLPIFPNNNLLINLILKIISVFIIYIYINYEHQIKEYKYSKKEKKEISPYKAFPIIFIIVLFIAFVNGLFIYKPLAIASNSMNPFFKKGSLIITKKIKQTDLNKIKVNDIIEYKLNNNIIIHRVIYIDKYDNNEKIYFTTKGDNNLKKDTKKVSKEQVIGIYKYSIPYLGYPSIWINDIIF